MGGGKSVCCEGWGTGKRMRAADTLSLSLLMGLLGEAEGGHQSQRLLLGESMGEAGGEAGDIKNAIGGKRFPIAGGVLMFLGLFLLVGACAGSNGRLHRADNQVLCVVIIGAACEVLAVMLISPLAAAVLSSLMIVLVAIACLHKSTRDACCPGGDEDSAGPAEVHDDAHEMLCML